MGGQDGYSRNVLNYNETSNSILAGVKIHPGDHWDLGLNVTYTASEGGIDPFDLPADDYVAITPPMSYDFSKEQHLLEHRRHSLQLRRHAQVQVH